MGKKKKKKKILHTGKLAVLGVLIAATLVFSFFFKDKLISEYLDRGLETVLQTPVDISALHAKILSSRLTIGSLAVVDKDNPGMYQFVLHAVTIDIDSAALLKGQFIIEKLESTGMEKEVPRRHVQLRSTVSSPSEPAKKEVTASPFKFPVISLDPKNIINNHKKDFASFTVLEDSKTTLETASQQLKTDTEALNNKFNQFKTKTAPLFTAKISTVQEGKKLLESVTAAVNGFKTISNSSRDLYKEVKSDTELIKKEKNRINKVLNEDFKRIDSFIAEPGSSIKHAASDYAQNLLKEKTGRYYTAVLKGITILKNLSSKKSKKNNYSRRKGRIVRFPEKELPLFLLKKAALTMAQNSRTINIDIENISSNAALTHTPATFSIDVKDNLSAALLTGSYTQNNSESGELKITGTLKNFDLGNQSVKGKYNASGNFSLVNASVLTGTADIKLIQAQLQNPQKASLIKEINTILSSSPNTALQAVFYIDPERSKITVTSSLDSLIQETVNRQLAAVSSSLKKRAKKEFEGRIKPQISTWDSSSSILKNLFKEEKNLNMDITGYNKKLAAEEARIKKELLKLSIPGAAGLKLPF